MGDALASEKTVRVSGCAGFVVTEAGIESSQVKFVVEQVIQGMFEGTGDQLPLQVNSEKPGAGVDVFVARHELLHPSE